MMGHSLRVPVLHGCGLQVQGQRRVTAFMSLTPHRLLYTAENLVADERTSFLVS